MTTELPGGRRCAVLGSPVAHSLSPALHRAAYRELGLDWRYDAMEVDAGGLAEFLGSLGPEWRGLSLTMPLKRVVMPLLAQVSDTARLAGVANTVLVGDDGTLAGHNTDVTGMVRALGERDVHRVATATVVGGGATATSALLALSRLGCHDLTLLVREPDRARETLRAADRLELRERHLHRGPREVSSRTDERRRSRGRTCASPDSMMPARPVRRGSTCS